MQPEKVIIALSSETSAARVGRIIEGAGTKNLTVQWEGSAESVAVSMGSGYRLTEHGSVTYQSMLSPEDLLAAVVAHPEEVFYEALTEFDFSSKKIDDFLSIFRLAGMPDDVVKAAWKQSVKALVAREDVQVVGGGNATISAAYKRIRPVVKVGDGGGDKRNTAAAATNAEGHIELHEVARTKKRKASPSSSDAGTKAPRDAVKAGVEYVVVETAAKSRTLPAETSERVETPGDADTPEQSPQETVVVRGVTASEAIDSLFRGEPWNDQIQLDPVIVSPAEEFILSLLRDGKVSTGASKNVSLNPLAAGLALKDYSVDFLANMLRNISPRESEPLLPALLSAKGMTAISELPDVEKWLGGHLSAKSLTVAVAEYVRDAKTGPSSEEIRQALLRLADVVVKNYRVGTLTNPTLVKLIIVGSIDTSPLSVRVTNRCLELVTALIRADNVPVSPSSDLENLALSISTLPLKPGAARAGLLAALGHASSKSVIAPLWWVGLDWDALLLLSTSPVSNLFHDEHISVAIVKPIVDKFVKAVDSRKLLSQLVGAPTFVTSLIEPSEIAALFQKITANDSLLASWVYEISQGDSRIALTEQLRVLEDAHGELQRQATAAPERIAELESINADLTAKLDEARESHAGLSSREKRQIAIDSYKALAHVAATIEQSMELEDVVIRKIDGIMERHGISFSARQGQTVVFNAELHSAPGTRPQAGASVVVGRTGYIWIDGDERAVLLQALVSVA